MENLGNKLLNVVSRAKKHVVLIAPFIKLVSLEKILSTIPISVQKIDCVTRWLPEDVVDGVLDLEIFDLLDKREGATLWKRKDLHAKFIRGDQRCLVGSANLTGRGLGWNFPCNHELMIEVDIGYSELQRWETELFAGSMRVTHEKREELAEQARKLSMERSPRLPVEVENETDPDHTWLPLCPSPEQLFGVYSGTIDQGDMVTSAFELAKNDLLTLDPPKGFSSEKEFSKFVATRLSGLEVFQKIIERSRTGLSDDQATEIVMRYLDQSHGIYPEIAWNSIKLWIMHFFSDQFRIESRQETLVMGKTLF